MSKSESSDLSRINLTDDKNQIIKELNIKSEKKILESRHHPHTS